MKILVTGGAGFIGSNLAAQLLQEGHTVVVFDNLSRAGTMINLNWLQTLPGDFVFVRGDLRDTSALAQAAVKIDACFHLAAQVAVTTSVVDPRSDFETNLLGTLNVLETVRTVAPEAALLFTSTNKVYGKMAHIPVVEQHGRYAYATLPDGVTEDMNLDFYSPYGCSKGGADQYVLDYARIYGLRTVVFRMSCIYGEHQMGNEDQGWVAHFLIRAALGGGLTIYGDGKQVRDALYIGDLVRAFQMALQQIDTVQGQAFNIGGGPAQTISLLDLLTLIEQEFGVRLPVAWGDWRPGDQKVYVSCIDKARKQLGWQPQVPVREGVARLYHWILDNQASLTNGRNI